MPKNLNTDDIKKALKVLGLSEGRDLTEDKLKQYYLKTMKRVHPDQGGNNFLSQQVNEARDILEQWIKLGKPSQEFIFTEDENNFEQSHVNQETKKKRDYQKNTASDTESLERKRSPEVLKSIISSVSLGLITLFLIFVVYSSYLEKPRNLSEHSNLSPIQIPQESKTSELKEISIRDVSNEMSAKKNETKISSEQAIAKSTGLLIKRKNKDGQELPISGGYEPDSRFVISFQEHDLFKDDVSAYVHFESVYNLGNEKVVLVFFASGGNACGATYRLVRIKEQSASITDEFGNCHLPGIKQKENRIEFSFYEGFGERLIVTYYAGKLTEDNITIPMHSDPENNGSGYNYLLKYIANNDIESFLTEKKVDKNLRELMGNDYELFKDRLVLYWSENQDGFINVSGQAAHSGGSEEAYLALALDESHIYAGILSTDVTKEVEVLPTVKIFSDKPAMFSKLPPRMNEWVARFPEAKIIWKFEN